MSSLFIPSKLRVGFQSRQGTYTGRLAYVIYYDSKGKLRKETSWQGWRDEKIEPEEFDNTPQDGFFLNKDIKRYNWSHFGSNRSYIRIYDSRGIEFEVTPENLIGILTETNCSKRGLDGKFVYAWCGTELVLLPCSSQAYQEAVEYTGRQGKKISARDLKPGCSYTTKKGEQVIYMGRFPWFTWDRYKQKTRISQKKHVFAYPKKPEFGNKFFPKGDASFLAELNSEDPVQNYAALVDKFNSDIHSSIIERWEVKPLELTQSAVFAREKNRWNEEHLTRHNYTEMSGEIVTFWRLLIVRRHERIHEYRLVKIGTLDTKQLTYQGEGRYYNYYYDDRPGLSEQQIMDKLAKFVEVDMILTSGKRLPLRDIESIARD